MPSRASSPPLAAPLLAALWLALGRCGASESPGPECDNGKLHLDRDLPSDAVYWGCPIATQPVFTQGLPSIDTVYDPETARQVCMDYPIPYNHTIPNSGAFRPVMTESGEYLYCPPQRWLNNLHHGASVLLYHPCAALRERLLLSGLARSCLPGHIITPHPQLSRDMPIALVSWGRTLELTTLASSDVCDWLQMTQATRNKDDGTTQTRKYNLLLTQSADLQHLGPKAETKNSVRQCCKQTISSLLRGTTRAVPSMKKDYWKPMKEGRRNREIRAANGAKRYISKRADKMTNDSSQINESIPQRKEDAHLLDPSFPRQTPQFEIQKQHQDITSLPTAHLVLHNAESLLQINSSQAEGADSVTEGVKERNSGKSLVVQGRMKDNEVVDVEERGEERNEKHNDQPFKFNSTSKFPLEHQQQKSQLEIDRQSSSNDCSDCKVGELCDCPETSGAESRIATLNFGLQRTPMTDEAVWAAAALGFLLVLLTLSILHTRLYHHWRTTPSLYWHDPRQDYDSVADVIRRRLKIAKRRRKRSRRKECVLLPSSSSSDENP